MRKTFDKIKNGLVDLPTKKQIEDGYNTLALVSKKEKKTLIQVSALIAGGIKRAGENIGQKYFVQSYVDTFEKINRIGWWTYIRRTFRPYLQAIARQLSPQKVTQTQKLLGFLG